MVSKNGEWEFSKEFKDNWKVLKTIPSYQPNGSSDSSEKTCNKVDLLKIEKDKESSKWSIVAAHEEGWFKIKKRYTGRVLTTTANSSPTLTKGNEIDLLFSNVHYFNFPYYNIPIPPILKLI